MRKLVVIASIVVLLAGCEPWWNVEDTYDPTFEEIPFPFFVHETAPLPPYPEGNHAWVFCRWILYEIEYVDDYIHDEAEYWQSPDQTYVWRTGDCEDAVVLSMYLIRKELGGWPQMVVGRIYQDGVNLGGHAWLEYESRWYESLTGEDVTDGYSDDGLLYVERDTLSYGESMWRSMNTHRSMKE